MKYRISFSVTVKMQNAAVIWIWAKTRGHLQQSAGYHFSAGISRRKIIFFVEKRAKGFYPEGTGMTHWLELTSDSRWPS